MKSMQFLWILFGGNNYLFSPGHFYICQLVLGSFYTTKVQNGIFFGGDVKICKYFFECLIILANSKYWC